MLCVCWLLLAVSRAGVGMPRTLRPLPLARRAAGRMLSTVPGAAGVETPGAVGLPPPGRAATFLRARFACTDEEVLRAERSLLPNQVHPGIDLARAGNTCDSLQSRLSLSKPELKKVVLKIPPVLGYSYEANLEPSLAALQSRLSLSEPELKKVVLGLPSVLGLSYEANIAPSLAALQSRLSLSEPDLKKVVLGRPTVLGLSYESNIAPSLAALQSRLSLSEPELKKVVLRLPQVLGFSYEANIAPSLAALQSRLSLSEPELKKVVLNTPPVLGYNFEANIAPSLAALQSRLSLSEPELKKVVLGLPSVLGFRFEVNIALTLAFMETAFHLAPDELRDRVVAILPLLSYSLELRYRPRVTLASALGVVVSQQMLTPAAMYDAKFMAWLRKREQLGLTDEEWAALCLVPLVERGGIPPVFHLYPRLCLTLALTRYSVTSKLSCTNQSSSYCPPHLHCPHDCNTIAIQLRNI